MRGRPRGKLVFGVTQFLKLRMCFLLFPLATLQAATYEGRNLDGWRLYVESSFMEQHSAVLQQVYTELHRQFTEIERAVPGSGGGLPARGAGLDSL